MQRVMPSVSRPQQPSKASEATEASEENAPESETKAKEKAAPAADAVPDVPAAVNVDALKTNGSGKYNPATKKKLKKVGPNDPCPCGSGLKYKKCHGRPW